MSITRRIRYSSLAIFLLTSSSLHAEPPRDLADFLSPDEIIQELGDPEPHSSTMAATAKAARLYVLVSKSAQRLWVYEEGRLTGTWPVSTGTETRRCAPTGRCYIARTPVGSFQPYRMEFEYTSKLWQARMDRAIFLTGGIALHATYGSNISLLGQRASGGCIRQSPENADLLFRLVTAYGRASTRVEIRD